MGNLPEDQNRLSPLKQALYTLREQRSRLERITRGPIAVVGVGCRFPGGGEGPDAFWSTLREGRNGIQEVPADRWDVDAFYDPDPDAPGKLYCRYGGFLESIDGFDARFFEIAPREARNMDPQQRLFLEVAWEAMESAGYTPGIIAGSNTGVYVGVSSGDYSQLQLEQMDIEDIDAYVGSGNAFSVVPGRLSHILGLQGPSLVVDTACSSSLVSVHLACQALRTDECELALAGGVNLILSPTGTLAFSKARMLAADGKCKAFDARADGYVRGEGCGVIVLKHLDRAVTDGDHIWAVIRGSAVNHDGRSGGLTVPNGPAQVKVIREALRASDLQPRDIQYVEAHGTGTSLGDPIEVHALGEVMKSDRDKETPLFIGSVKTNIGHLESAAGVAGLIKVILALYHREIPPNLHFETLNPHIARTRWPFEIPTVVLPWKGAGEPRRAGVSAFAFNGTNAHVIVEEAPPVKESSQGRTEGPHLLPLSARDQGALLKLAGRYGSYLESRPATSLADLCFTAGTGRRHFPQRMAVLGATAGEMAGYLDEAAEAPSSTAASLTGRAARSSRSNVVFLFPGEGVRIPDMGRQLYNRFPLFRESMDRCSAVMEARSSPPLSLGLWSGPGEGAVSDSTSLAHPALFAIEYAIASQWRAWGVEPSALLGCGAGEIAAACVAGVFSLEDALGLVIERAALMSGLTESMGSLAIFGDPADIDDLLADGLDQVAVAAVHGPGHWVLSGEKGALEAIEKDLGRRGIRWLPLIAHHAIHAPLADPLLDRFECAVSRVSRSDAGIDIVSSATGAVNAPGETTDPDYWRRQLGETIRFHDGIRTLQEQYAPVFLEVGPGTAMIGTGRRCLSESEVSWISSMRPGSDECGALLHSLGQLYINGCEIDWDEVHRGGSGRKILLPSYPFQRERFWFSRSAGRAGNRYAAGPAPVSAGRPMLGSRILSPLDDIQYENHLTLEAFPFLRDHRVFDRPILPAAAFLEMILEVGTEIFGASEMGIEDILIQEPLIFSGDGKRTVQLVASRPREDSADVRIYSYAPTVGEDRPGEWRLNAVGRIVRGGGTTSAERGNAAVSIRETIEMLCPEEIRVEDFYTGLAGLGIQYGPCFQGVRQLWRGEGTAVGRLASPADDAETVGGYLLHPVLLDSAMQLLIAAGSGLETAKDELGTYLPVGMKAVEWFGGDIDELWGRAEVLQSLDPDDRTVTGNLSLYNGRGDLIAGIREVVGRKVSRDALARAGGAPPEDCLYEMKWSRKPLHSSGGCVDYMPCVGDLAEGLRTHTARLIEEYRLEQYRELWPQLGGLISNAIVIALEGMGWGRDVGDRFTPDQLLQELGIAKAHHKLTGRFLQILAEQGTLRADEGLWVIERLAETVEPGELRRKLLQDFPDCSAEINMAGDFGDHLADLLQGRLDPLEILFPRGSTEKAEKLYRDAPFPKALNALTTLAVGRAIERLPAWRSAKILEIGAGTGGTTAAILPLLRDRDIEYTFTDISPLFTANAEAAFSSYDFMRYEVLDIESDPLGQGFQEGDFDIVVAANVLHATGDLRETLANVKRLLAPGGLLMLIEGTGPDRLLDVVFGFTEGWWRFTDLDLRPDYPLLSERSWHALLGEQGFSNSASLPGAERFGDEFSPQTLILSSAVPVGCEAGTPPPRGERRPHRLILADRSGRGRVLADRISASGGDCSIAFAGECFESVRDGEGWTVRSDSGEDFGRLLDELFVESGRAELDVIHLWSLDHGTDEATNTEELLAAQDRGCRSAISVVQSLLGREGLCARLWLVTSGAQSMGTGTRSTALAHAPLWGLGKVIALEHPELQCARIDVDPFAGIDIQVSMLFDELERNDGEEEIVHRDQRRHVQRLVEANLPEGSADTPPPVLPEDAGALRLRTGSSGVLDDLDLHPVERGRPGPHEVEIKVRAAGLNFLDVLNALKALPFKLSGTGAECSGRVIDLGREVDGLEPGDEVMGLVSDCFGTHATAPALFLVKKPEGLSHFEAATIPVAFMTAYDCLHRIAAMRLGDKVLIHAAAGGVGMAAVQLARRAGAQIFATAGSPYKRNLVRAMGVEQVFDSRSLAFSEGIMGATGGGGVDIVLNCLSDDFISASLDVLGIGGRFLEIGKRGVWSPERVGEIRPDVQYTLYDLITECRQNPSAVRETLETVAKGVTEGELEALPRSIFPITEAGAGFRHMAQARHTGKIVFDIESADALLGEDRRALSADASYLITGGLGGLGLLVADWMIDKGARNIALLGRSSPNERARRTIAALEERGCTMRIIGVDVSVQEDLRDALDSIRATMPTLKGVVHAAGVLDDGVLLQQSWPRFQKVMAPKVAGAWNLHRLTGDADLDFFVLFSSSASFLGSPGQANHAAANAFLDELAHYRRQRGLPSLSINWGAWSEIGAAAERNVGEQLGRQGILTISPEKGIEHFERLLGSGLIRAAVIPIEWTVVADLLAGGDPPPLFEEILRRQQRSKAISYTTGPTREELDRLLGEAMPAEREGVVRDFVQEQVSHVLGIDSSKSVEVWEPLDRLGIDSLMAVELRNAFARICGRQLPVTLLFDYPTIEAISGYIYRDVLGYGPEPEPEPAETGAEALLAGDIEALSEDDLDAELMDLVNAELEGPGLKEKD